MRTRNITIAALLCLALVPAAFAQNTAKPVPAAPPGKMAAPAAKPVIKKKMPPRDPKTGRFMKSGTKMAEKGPKGGAMTGTGDKTKKKMPARDPKTGKFIKASPKP